MICWKQWSNTTQNANHTTADHFCSAELPPLPTSAENVLTPSPNPDPLHTTSEPRPTVTYPPQSPDNFCASKAGGDYAKPDDPGSFYSCANGITWVMPCPANLVFLESCLCCSYPWEKCMPFLKKSDRTCCFNSDPHYCRFRLLFAIWVRAVMFLSEIT